MTVDGKIALVTGGARRIGAAISRDLAAYGFKVAIHHNGSDEEAEALSSEIAAAGGQAFTVVADLTDVNETAGLIESVSGQAGAPCLLVNNASVFEEDAVTNLDDAVWDTHFDLHLKAPATLTSHLARNLPADDAGLVVNIIDQRIWKLTPRYFSYTLSKSALWTATQTMAQALAPRIRVNAIGPGPTLPNERQSDADFKHQVMSVPLQRGPSLAEFGATIRWLWETPSVTGQMVALDGGQHLAWKTPDVSGIGE